MGDEQPYVRETDDPSDRLLALTLVLVSSPHGLTKNELFESVRGYRMDQQKGISAAALDKKFERDLTDLRELGIDAKFDPISQRHKLNREGFAWPKGTTLSPKQLQLLALAGQVWAMASLNDQARQALTKLKAIGSTGDSESLIGYAPRIRTHEPAFMPLTVAIRDKSVVEFGYRKPGYEPETRTVSPWQLINVSGQWLVLGWDHNVEASRHFMLKRIVTNILVIEDAEPREASAAEVADAKAGLEEHTANQLAVIQVERDSEPWFRFEMDLDPKAVDGRLEINFMDLHLLAEDLREYGSAIRVVSPKALVDAVRIGFEKVVDDHA
jgi:proteasome accessory factor B